MEKKRSGSILIRTDVYPTFIFEPIQQIRIPAVRLRRKFRSFAVPDDNRIRGYRAQMPPELMCVCRLRIAFLRVKNTPFYYRIRRFTTVSVLRIA